MFAAQLAMSSTNHCVNTCSINDIIHHSVPFAFSALALLDGGRKGIRPVKKLSGGRWRGYLSGARCRLAYGPADAIATHCLLLQ